jgi:hypothetical protein
MLQFGADVIIWVKFILIPRYPRTLGWTDIKPMSFWWHTVQYVTTKRRYCFLKGPFSHCGISCLMRMGQCLIWKMSSQNCSISLINFEITLQFVPLYRVCDYIDKELEVPLSLSLKFWRIFCSFHEAVEFREIQVSESVWIPNRK